MMDLDNILSSNSTEVKHLFQLMDQIKMNIESRTGIEKPGLFGERFLDNNEVCKMLHLSVRTLQDYRDRGLIAFYKLEGKILYKLSDIHAMLNNNYYDAWSNKR